MKDRAMQALYALALIPIAEPLADANSYGFREKRSVVDAIAQCFTCLAKKVSPQWMLEADIKACFDEIDHDWLIQHVRMDKRILRQWLKSGYLERGTFRSTEKGTPQGGIMTLPTILQKVM
jgi:RNA-directed DNA polymerase